jgi:alkyl sulfatase BDS1-like metallo-beta-lactamase superfamily hydrolase
MFPSPNAHKSARLTELMGGVEAVLEAAKQDHADGDHQLAAELAQIALRADPDNRDARMVKAAALRARGYQELNPIARSWYLTGALELEGTLDPGVILQAYGALFSVDRPVPDIVRGWRYQLDAEAAKGLSVVVGVRDADSGEELTVRVRNRVLHVSDGIDEDAATVVEATPEQVGGSGEVTLVSGDLADWERLQAVLDTEWTTFHMHMR